MKTNLSIGISKFIFLFLVAEIGVEPMSPAYEAGKNTTFSTQPYSIGGYSSPDFMVSL